VSESISSSSNWQLAWWSSKRPVSACTSAARLDPHPAPREFGQHSGVALARDQRLDHRPPRNAHDVRPTVESLIRRVLEQLLEPLKRAASGPRPIDPQPGVVTQPSISTAGRTTAEHAALVELRQPDRVELVGLGTPRDVLQSRAFTSHTVTRAPPQVHKRAQ